MNDLLLERAVVSIERMVQQQDESVERIAQREREGLARRAEDVARVERQHADNVELAERTERQLDTVIAKMARLEEIQSEIIRRLLLVESATSAGAVDPHVSAVGATDTGTLTTRE